MTRGFRRRFKPLELLTDEQCNEIHHGMLEVLEKTGVLVEHERALDLFHDNGCRVDFEKKRVRIPSYIVEEALKKAPNIFTVRARDSKDDIIIGGDTVYFTLFPGMDTVDLHTWEPRPPTLREHNEYIMISDALPNCHFLACYPYFGYKGVPEVLKILEGIAVKLRNTTMVQTCCYSHDCEQFTVRLVEAIDGMEAMGATHSAPPLSFAREMIETYFRYLEADFPLWIGGGPVMGGTTPVTIAGSMVVSNAEMVAAVVISQLIRPGARVMVHDYALPINMRTGSPDFGAVEAIMHQAVFNQMWRRYGIPAVSTNAGPVSSKKIDFQCGYEKALSALSAAISGVNVIQFSGGLYGELAAHPVQAVLDDDIAGMVGRYLEGVSVNSDTLALDIIEEVGPIPGHYVGKAHTREWWQKEFFMPRAADRLPLPEWLKTGKKVCLDYARERMEELLSASKPKRLTDEQEQKVEEIMKEAREYYRKNGLVSDSEWKGYREVIESADYPYSK